MESDGEKKKKAVLPWGMTAEALQPNSVKAISKTKQSAFALGRMNPLKKSSQKKKEEREEKKKLEDAKAAADVFEQFVASFEESTTSGKTFIRGSTFQAGSDESPKADGGVYKPTSKLLQKVSQEKEKSLLSVLQPTRKPVKKKGVDKKKSILELFRDELKRAQEDRKDRHSHKQSSTALPLDEEEEEEEETDATDIFKVDEYKDYMKGSYDLGDPLTTNLYVGNINPKMNEEMLCQTFGKYGPLASVKVMWPRTEEEKARNKNCGFVAFMKREHAEKALEFYKGTILMEFEVQVGWGKAVPIPPHPIYVPPDVEKEEKAKVPDPPSGLPFNAQPIKPSRDKEGEEQSFEDMLYSSMVRVVIPTDTELLVLIHRMIEFVVREGPMFEAMIMNRELNNPMYQFLFDNQGPAHIYYRWKLFSILQGDSPETWHTDDFRMFEGGSLWKPPPLKKVRPPVEPPPVEHGSRRGQLTSRHRDDLEDQLRNISIERSKINLSMIWCLDHADSAEEIVDWITESLCIAETPLPLKVARLYLVNDILHNCSASAPNSSKLRRGFEGKLVQIVEHFHTVYVSISSRIRAEQFKRRVLTCLRAWDLMSIYHFNLVDKLRELFIGKTQEEAEKQKAFETVAALITTQEEPMDVPVSDDIDGLPLLDNTPIDFSKGISIDKTAMGDDLDGTPLITDSDLDGVPLNKAEDIDGVPLEVPSLPPSASHGVRSKWELVDYDSDQDDEEGSTGTGHLASASSGNLSKKNKQQLLAELNERKRKILREVELKVVELSDALEASGSYSKVEIAERIEKFRDKLMQEAVEPKSSPPRARHISRSPSPTALAKYRLEESPKVEKIERSPSPSPGRARQTRKRERSRSPTRKRSRSPSPARKRSSPARKRSRSRSPTRKRSRSPSPANKRSSPARKRSRSRSPARKRSRSPSPARKRSSPARKRSRSPSPARKRSSPARKRSRSPSPARKRSRSPSPARKRSRSPSPARKRSRSRSPARKRSRSRSRSPKHRHRSRSRSPKSHRHQSRSPSGRSSKKNKKRSRSRSPHKTKSSSKRNSKR